MVTHVGDPVEPDLCHGTHRGEFLRVITSTGGADDAKSRPRVAAQDKAKAPRAGTVSGAGAEEDDLDIAHRNKTGEED